MSISDMAKKLRQRSELLEGREVISSDDVARLFKKGFTIEAIDLQKCTDRKTGEPRHYYIIAIKEDDTVAIGSGQVLTNLLDELVNMVGSVEEFNAAMKLEDFILIPSMEKSKNGNRYLNFDIA